MKRPVKLVDFLAQGGDSFTLSRISRELGYSVSTTHHIIRTLVDYDYVVQDPETRRYAIGFKFLTVGRAILDRLDIRRIAAPHLRKLHQACQEAVHLAVLRNGRVVYIDKIDSGGGLSLANPRRLRHRPPRRRRRQGHAGRAEPRGRGRNFRPAPPDRLRAGTSSTTWTGF